MKLKKIISITFLSIMALLLLSTTAMAQVANKYYQAYSYSGKGNEMKWFIKGTDTKVSTKATNPTSYSRYVQAAVVKKNRFNGVEISSKIDENTGKQMYASASMKRVLSDSNIIYSHQAVLKPYASSGYTIDSKKIDVYQLPSN